MARDGSNRNMTMTEPNASSAVAPDAAVAAAVAFGVRVDIGAAGVRHAVNTSRGLYAHFLIWVKQWVLWYRMAMPV